MTARSTWLPADGDGRSGAGQPGDAGRCLVLVNTLPPGLQRSAPDECSETATVFGQRAPTFFASHGITVEKALTNNGACYKSRHSAHALHAPGVTHKRIRPY